MNALVPIGLPTDWFIDRPVDFAFGITAEPQRSDPYYPRNPSGYVYQGPITTLRGRRPKGLRDAWWLRAKARRKTARAARRRNR